MSPTVKDYCWRIANIILAGSTLRNQGAPGVSQAAREFVTNLDLKLFVSEDERAFQEELDRQTELLKRQLPAHAQNWGTARKAINLFLAEAQYHRAICQAYGLERIVPFLEIPLDGQVGECLTKRARKSGDRNFPQWPGIIHLTPPISNRYQQFASVLAKQEGADWSRIHLDVLIWRAKKGPVDWCAHA